jgi:hypothetical protein
MIPSGRPHNEMMLSGADDGFAAVTAAGRSLV